MLCLLIVPIHIWSCFCSSLLTSLSPPQIANPVRTEIVYSVVYHRSVYLPIKSLGALAGSLSCGVSRLINKQCQSDSGSRALPCGRKKRDIGDQGRFPSGANTWRESDGKDRNSQGNKKRSWRCGETAGKETERFLMLLPSPVLVHQPPLISILVPGPETAPGSQMLTILT